MMDPQRFGRRLARLRIVVYVGLVALVAFGLWRYDLVRVPPDGCSPVEGFEPGDRLLVDLHPAGIEVGDAVLYRSPAGELLLGRVTRPPASAPEDVWAACRAGALWIVGERPDCPQADSRRHGPIDTLAVTGRVAACLPW